MFLHHGGAQKADLLRRGDIQLSDLIAHQPRRDDSTPLPEETSLSALEAIATARHLVARGRLPDGILQMPANLRPSEWDALLRERLGGWAEIARPDGSMVRARPPVGGGDRVVAVIRSPIGDRVDVWKHRLDHAQRERPRRVSKLASPSEKEISDTIAHPDLIARDSRSPLTRRTYVRRTGDEVAIIAIVDAAPDGPPYLVTSWREPSPLRKAIVEREQIWHCRALRVHTRVVSAQRGTSTRCGTTSQ